MAERIFSRLRVTSGVLLILGALLPGAQGAIDLGDIVGGGDGTGTGIYAGINPDTGSITNTVPGGAVSNTGENPQVVDIVNNPLLPVPAAFIDCVFIMTATPFPITSLGAKVPPEGPTFAFTAGDIPGTPDTWRLIFSDRNQDNNTTINLNGQLFTSCVATHSPDGITFDLTAIRDAIVTAGGDLSDVSKFVAYVGEDAIGCWGDFNTYVIFSDETKVISSWSQHINAQNPGPIRVDLGVPADAIFLTLATGAADGGNGCDHGTFANARLVGTQVLRDIPTFAAGDEIQITLSVKVAKAIDKLVVEERIPRGFIASSPSAPGTIDETTTPGRQTITWDLSNVTADLTLTYNLLIPDPYPASLFNKSTVTADDVNIPIEGDQKFLGGVDFVTEGLVAVLRQPTTGCGGAAPGEAAIRQDYITDGDTSWELTAAPYEGQHLYPDYLGASPSPGPITTTSDTWTRIDTTLEPSGNVTAGVFKLNDLTAYFGTDPNDVVGYVAFYATNLEPATITAVAGEGADDGTQILVDGKEKYIRNGGWFGAVAAVGARSLPFELTPGKHLIMHKTFEGCGGFNSCIRFEDEDQNPLALLYSLDPDGYTGGSALVVRGIPDTLDVGETGTISIKLRVPDSNTATDVVIEETVPDGFAISGITGPFTQEGQKITWSIPGLPVNQDFTYQVSIPEDALDSTFQGTATLGGVTIPFIGDTVFNRGIMDQTGFIGQWLILSPLETLGLWPGAPAPNNPANANSPSATPENDPDTGINDIYLDYLTDGETVDSINEKTIRPFEGMRINPAFKGDGETGAKSLGLEALTGTCMPESPTWTRWVCPGSTVDLNQYAGQEVESCTVYGACYITLAEERAVFLGIDSDDAFIAYIDGVEAVMFNNGPCSATLCGRGMGAEGTAVNASPAAITLSAGEHFLLVRVHEGAGGAGFRVRFQDEFWNPILPPAITVSLKSKDTPPDVYVQRFLSSKLYRPAAPITVTLQAEVKGTHDVLISEALPAGFSAADITPLVPVNQGVIEWTLPGLTAGTHTVSYRLIPGPCAADGAFCGNGSLGSSYTVDGTRVNSLLGDSQFSRDTKFSDNVGPSWDSRDIGYPTGGTNDIVGPTEIEVMGLGTGLAGPEEFRFVSVPQTGDFEISARIDCFQSSTGTGLAGLMVRNDYEQGSVFGFMGITASAATWKFQGYFRNTTLGGIVLTTPTNSLVRTLPIWVRVVKVTDPVKLTAKLQFYRRALDTDPWGTAFYSRDMGANLHGDMFIGLAVSGGGGSTRTRFSQVGGLPALPPFPEVVANKRPTARIVVTPSSGQVLLVGGVGQATLDGSTSDDGDGGTQGLTYSWTKVSGPAGDTIVSPSAASTKVNFTAEGTFDYRLTVNDGQSSDNTDTETARIVVTISSGGSPFKRGDVDADGVVNITDVIAFLGWNFRGDPPTLDCPDSADSDDSGDLNVTDAIVTLGWNFRGDPAVLQPPGSDTCGPDDTITPTPPIGECNYPPDSCSPP